MGAGPSKEQVYQYVYRRLHEIQRELAESGVESFYKSGNLRGMKNAKDFHIWVKRSNASNGECFLYPVATVSIEGVTEVAGKRKYLYFGGVPWSSTEPSFEVHGKPLIIRHFGGNNGPTE